MTEEREGDEWLGEPLGMFRPGMGNIIAGWIFVVLLSVGGVLFIGFSLRETYRAGGKLPFFAERGSCWFSVVAGIVFGALFLGLAWLLFHFVRYLRSHRVEICDRGFLYCAEGKVSNVLWSDVTLIRQTTLYETPPVLKGPARHLLPKVASTRYAVFAKEQEFSFDGNTVSSIKQVGELLQEHAELWSLPWEHVEEQG